MRNRGFFGSLLCTKVSYTFDMHGLGMLVLYLIMVAQAFRGFGTSLWCRLVTLCVHLSGVSGCRVCAA